MIDSILDGWEKERAKQRRKDDSIVNQNVREKEHNHILSFFMTCPLDFIFLCTYEKRQRNYYN